QFIREAEDDLARVTEAPRSAFRGRGISLALPAGVLVSASMLGIFCTKDAVAQGVGGPRNQENPVIGGLVGQRRNAPVSSPRARGSIDSAACISARKGWENHHES